MIKVYTAGTWDMFHVGHLNILKRSKELGDHLIVGVSTDELVYNYKLHKPIIPFKDRLEIIKSCRYVDEVFVQTKLLDIKDLESINPDIFTIGSDWANKSVPGIDYLKRRNKNIIILDYTQDISSTLIKERIRNGSYI